MLKMIIKLTYDSWSVTQCHRAKKGWDNELMRARESAALAFASCQQKDSSNKGVRTHLKCSSSQFNSFKSHFIPLGKRILKASGDSLAMLHVYRLA